MPWRPQIGEAMEAFCWIKSTKSILFACKTYHFPQIRNEKGQKSTALPESRRNGLRLRGLTVDNRQEAAGQVDETKIPKVFALTFVGYELFQNLKTHFAPFLSYSFTHETLDNAKLHSLSFLCKNW